MTPGKIILFGEHAVVYGYPGIALPLTNVSTTTTITYSDSFSVHSDKELYKEEKAKLAKLVDFIFFNLDVEKKNARILVKSTIPVASGLGSSAALSVSIIRAASKYFDLELNDDKVNSVAFECEKFFHGTPSGIDNSVVTYNKPVYFKKGNIEFIDLSKPVTFIIANSGVKSDTGEVVAGVRKRHKELDYSKYFEEIGEITLKAKHALIKSDIRLLGELMIQKILILLKVIINLK